VFKNKKITERLDEGTKMVAPTQQSQHDQEDLMLKQYEAEQNAIAQQQNNQLASSFLSAPAKQNLVEWQLDFKSELEDIERALRCDIISRDKDGNQIWIANPDKSRIFMNEQGVNDVIRTILLFINKGKILSNYGKEEIGPRVKMIMNEIRVLVYNNYEAYGIDNAYKMNNYSIIVLSIGTMIEDAYKRAINGMERKDLNQARIVQQNEPLMGAMPQASSGSQSKKSWLKPWTWG
jgi:hypothetical protein